MVNTVFYDEVKNELDCNLKYEESAVRFIESNNKEKSSKIK